MILRSSKDGFMPPVLLHSLDDGNDGSWCDNHDGREESPAATAATRIQTQLRSLQAIDEALERIAITLDDLHLTDETYFLYTSGAYEHRIILNASSSIQTSGKNSRTLGARRDEDRTFYTLHVVREILTPSVVWMTDSFVPMLLISFI